MRVHIINFLKQNPFILKFVYFVFKYFLGFLGMLLPIKEKTMIFSSFGGRKFDDSPKAIYDEILTRKEFSDWKLIWTFVNPSDFEIPKGDKVRVDTFSFFKALLTSRVWIGNSDIARGIDIHKSGIIKVETWHGTPLKKICGEENTGTIGNIRPNLSDSNKDGETIRCAQSEYDREIFTRIFHARKEAILLSDLPRNDILTRYTLVDKENFKEKLNISQNKKVLLYMPTYREYLIEDNEIFLAPPLDFKKWEKLLGDEYVILVRAHYAVSKALNLEENEFLRDVSNYPTLNELYCIADAMISDYSSSFIDYAILERPMLCFAYDREEYEEKRGMYIDIKKELPCPICYTEDELLDVIKNMDYGEYSARTKKFKEKYAPYAGNAAKCVVDKLIDKLKK